MLNLGGNNVLALLVVEVRDALDGQIIRFSGARGPHDFSRVRVDQLRDVIACILNCFLGFPAKNMGTGRRITKHTLRGKAG